MVEAVDAATKATDISATFHMLLYYSLSRPDGFVDSYTSSALFDAPPVNMTDGCNFEAWFFGIHSVRAYPCFSETEKPCKHG